MVIYKYYQITLWLFNIAMENDPFIDDVPIIFWLFNIAMCHPWITQPPLVATRIRAMTCSSLDGTVPGSSLPRSDRSDGYLELGYMGLIIGLYRFMQDVYGFILFTNIYSYWKWPLK